MSILDIRLKLTNLSNFFKLLPLFSKSIGIFEPLGKLPSAGFETIDTIHLLLGMNMYHSSFNNVYLPSVGYDPCPTQVLCAT